MTARVLAPATIIPAHLYVERSADRQLKTVIDEMGRPGYILVSRQMGKTNLLLNMKRNRSMDLVVYFDLSNRFETARKFFRNIIDTILEMSPELFESAAKVIDGQRRGDELEDSVEYDRHLRLLLKSANKKIVIILDEIDSLIGCTYSDSILAQVRSMYFSRGNHEIYNNLTYVLSGVAEPGDLIKDKNISPFNIGEKIYLEDFTRSEFDEFVSRAKLKVGSSVSDRIYWWTDGNPRISWDICSEVELEIAAGKDATPLLVDEIVDRLYYQEHDRAPVDHIRALVEGDASIRNAIMSIRYDRGNFADDRVKGKLYLAGIAKSDRALGIVIKNRVIDGALSERWIKQLEDSEPSALTIASEAFSAKDYVKAKKYFAEVFAADVEELVESKRIDYASSLFYSGDFNDAIDQYELIEAETVDERIRQLCSLQAGGAYLALKNYQSALNKLQTALVGPDRALVVSAKLNLQVAYARMKVQEYRSAAISLSEDLIEQIQSINEPDQKYLLTTALANASLIYSLYGNKDLSTAALERARSVAPLEFMPFLLVEGLKRSDEANEKKSLLAEFVELVTDNRLKLISDAQSPLGLTKLVLSLAVVGLATYADDQFDSFVRVIKDKYYQPTSSIVSILIDLAEAVETEDNSPGAVLLLRAESTYLTSDVPEFERIRLYRHLANSQSNVSAGSWGMKFLRTLNAHCPPDLLGEQDAIVAANFMVGRFSSKRSELAECFELWRRFEDTASEKWPEWGMLFLYLQMQCALDVKNVEDSSLFASKIISVSEKLEMKGKAFEALAPFLNGANDHLRSIKSVQLKNFKRNDKVVVKYKDADPIVSKFKNVEGDLRSGLCTLIGRS
ncbi:AAA-like domain-containing protein [Pseudomonas urmiensis]|uniref:AAA-like domain-containing protein n=1 Tax=Pseudomonas urmiensis TaxID=2745493 RepID=A0A923FVZ9_9PSED|nr:AAA-like domain-containing protein [Pseudomonas urmiensis]MBV4538762.1 AAA-like domain-containing protein [Pseudomonas urmiensis]